MRIMKDICFLDVHTDDINVVALDNPEFLNISDRRIPMEARLLDDE